MVSRPSRFEAWYGRDDPPERVVPASLGDLAFAIHGVDVRRLRYGPLAILDRIYVAVRDTVWDTIPGIVSDVEIGNDPHTPLRMTFHVHHQAGDIRFDWAGLIALRADGELTYRMDGVAGSDFRYNRLGICVLHPASSTAGRPWTATTVTGPESGTFPALIGPQELTDGVLHAITPPLSGLDIALEGAELSLRLAGDLFETEDQRNWTDDSFKTYSTPISLGAPHQARQGQVFHQQVVARVVPVAVSRGTRRRVEPVASDAPVELVPGAARASWPAIGLGGRAGGSALRARERALLRMVHPDHVRADLRPGRGRWRADLTRAVGDARALDCALELALTLRGADDPGVLELANALRDSPIARVLVFDERADPSGSTPEGLVGRVRSVMLGAADRVSAGALGTASWLGGTDGAFSELNRDRPELDGLEGLSWSMQPQVHATDELSMAETLPAQAMTVATARSFAPGRALAVSPVTLQPRHQASPDPRQATLFAAGWTVGSLASLLGSEIASVTWYELVGPGGLLDRHDRPTTGDWPAWASGAVFPLWHVFADLGDRAAGASLPVPSPDRDVVAMGIRFPDRLRLLVANLRPDPVECRLVVGDAPWARLRVLDHDTIDDALRQPETFRERTDPVPVGGDRVALRLGAFVSVMVEAGTRS